MTTHEVEIRMSQRRSEQYVKLDGVDVGHLVTDVHAHRGLRTAPTVELTLMPSAIHLHSSGVVVVDEQSAALLVDLGWTPPPFDDRALALLINLGWTPPPFDGQVTS